VGFPPKKYAPKQGSGYAAGFSSDLSAIYHIFRKNQRFSRRINALPSSQSGDSGKSSAQFFREVNGKRYG
jgi:hypothetical protein